MLTAGHCVNNRARQPKTVRLGRVSLSTEIDDENDPNPAQDILIKVHFQKTKSNSTQALNLFFRKFTYIQLIHPERSTMTSRYLS